MKRFLVFAALCVVLVVPSQPTAVGQRGTRGGVRGGTVARPSTPAISRPPTVARPSMPITRPSPRPSIGPSNISRPQFASPRPSPSTLARPTIPKAPTVSRPATLPARSPITARSSTPGLSATGPTGGPRPTTGAIVPKAGPIGGGSVLATRPVAKTPAPKAPVPPKISGGLAGRPGPLPKGPATLPKGPTTGAITRPNIPATRDRPQRPVIADGRGPGGGPGIRRPPVTVGDRTIQRNITNVNVNRWAQYNQRIGRGYHPVWRRPAYWNRPWYANRPAWYWGRPWYGYHWHWHHGFWSYWRVPPIFWFETGLVIGWLSSPGYTVVYSNPYWVPPPVVVYDYSLPLPLPTPEQVPAAFPPSPDEAALEAGEMLPTTAPPPPEPDTAAKEATRLFDLGRDLFKEGKYAEAERMVDQAIVKQPSDGTLHEFRALALFAQGKYRDAAAALYAVLAAGPGWDWETMKFLYGNERAYTGHLRALEEFTKENPKAGYAHFLLAYQYLVLGSKEAAVKELQEVVRIQPDDQLAAALLKSLSSKE